jgi:hypothetical protein
MSSEGPLELELEAWWSMLLWLLPLLLLEVVGDGCPMRCIADANHWM